MEMACLTKQQKQACPVSYTLVFPAEIVCRERKTSDLLAFYTEVVFKMWN